MKVTFQLRYRGFTTVELVVVAALLVVIAVMLMSGISQYGKREQFKQFASSVETIVHDAKHRAIAAEDGTAWGVYVSPTTIELFPGTNVTPGASVNTIVAVPNYVVATSSFYTDDWYLVFSERTGLPNATGTISLFDTRTISTSTVFIEAAGLIE